MIINHKKTKIVATLGPASDDLSVMTEMVKAGVNVFRINMSHATPEQARVRAERVRQINARFVDTPTQPQRQEQSKHQKADNRRYRYGNKNNILQACQ